MWNSSAVLLLRNILWVLLLPGVIAGYIPWQVFGVDLYPVTSARQISGLFLFAAGVLVLLVGIAEFARRGKGTLSPMDPPRILVVTGLYRYVRNPMYVGVLITLLGEVLISGSRGLALYTGAFFVCVNLFVMGYEEPHLRRTFGASYMEYKKHVGRWVPRAHPWRGHG